MTPNERPSSEGEIEIPEEEKIAFESAAQKHSKPLDIEYREHAAQDFYAGAEYAYRFLNTQFINQANIK